MIVLIPMMGIGKRFSEADYTTNKPLIRTGLETMLEAVVKPLIKKFGFVFIACNHKMYKCVRKLFPSEVVRIIQLNETRGAAETVHLALKEIEQEGPVLCVDCDTILSPEALDLIPTAGNAILTFKDEARTGIFSYLRVAHSSNVILDIVEKQAVSELANAGVYMFQSRGMAKYLTAQVDTVGERYQADTVVERYLSAAVKRGLEAGYIFQAIDITGKFDCVGTPAQLQAYAKSSNIKGKIFCFDIDKTLVYDINDYPAPVQENVDFCNYVYHAGATVILHTARGMLSLGGNLPAIEETYRLKTESILKACGINYHSLIFGKPFADYYIDDKAINSHLDLNRETGVYVDIDCEPRAHHKIEVHGDRVIKTGSVAYEAMYYNSLPKNILDGYFCVDRVDENKLSLLKINEPTYSKLLLTNKLTEAHIEDLFYAIYRIQNCVVPNEFVNPLWGYWDKLKDRLGDNKEFYDSLGITWDDVVAVSKYKPVEASVIHGDPVFTNVFRSGFNGCILIDPRGEWDGKPSIHGESDYDFAKIYQSLLGYDFVLCGMEEPGLYTRRLAAHFEHLYVRRLNRSLENLRFKTYSLILSMLPLHQEDRQRCERFVKWYRKLTDTKVLEV